MTIEQIKEAIEAGQKVCVGNEAYEARKDRLDQYHIICIHNNYAIGLTWADGITMNDEPENFYIAE